jgi:8-oxo-dGTP pyrophosphatase MutT (NUDIX family)
LPQSPADVPRIPASAGALIYDGQDRLLILEPTYKKGWSIPGGQIDPNGESPWDACRREALEECGLELTHARLACVDYLPPRKGRAGGVRFVFDCGHLPESELARIRLQEDEIRSHRFLPLEEALELLSGPLRRRVGACARQDRCVYLEDGRPVVAVD